MKATRDSDTHTHTVTVTEAILEMTTAQTINTSSTGTCTRSC